MKHIFVVNPAAGQGKIQPALCREIEQICRAEQADFEIYRTTGVNDATRFVKEALRTQEGPLRFYACGGDGTLNEVVTALIGQTGAEAAMIPVGTGNDFPRSFDRPALFGDLRCQLRGTAVPVDVMEALDEETGNKHYAVNVLNMGFDSDVAMRVSRVKRFPLMKGHLAYVAALAITLFHKLGKQMRITFEDGEELTGSFLLTGVGNGRSCGGGFLVAPKASVMDGLLDVGVVRTVNRPTFLSLVSAYKDGSYIDKPSAKPYVLYRRIRRMQIEIPGGVPACLDGEMYPIRRLSLELLPAAVAFSVPEGALPLNAPVQQPVMIKV